MKILKLCTAMLFLAVFFTFSACESTQERAQRVQDDVIKELESSSLVSLEDILNGDVDMSQKLWDYALVVIASAGDTSAATVTECDLGIDGLSLRFSTESASFTLSACRGPEGALAAVNPQLSKDGTWEKIAVCPGVAYRTDKTSREKTEYRWGCNELSRQQFHAFLHDSDGVPAFELILKTGTPEEVTAFLAEHGIGRKANFLEELSDEELELLEQNRDVIQRILDEAANKRSSPPGIGSVTLEPGTTIGE